MKIIKKREDDCCLLSRSRSIKRVTYPKSDRDKFTEAAMEVLIGYGGSIDGREQDFQNDVMLAASRKGVGFSGKSRKSKRR